MTASILSETALPGLPSASGIEVIDPVAYIIGDDSPFVYLLDVKTLASQSQVRLFETEEFDSGRIPKKKKPDIEAITALTWPDGRAGILVLGSGSRPVRETGWFVPTSGEDPLKVSLSALYAVLHHHLPAGADFNVEAAATTATELLLFQRTVATDDEKGPGSLVFVLPLADTLALLADYTTTVPNPHVHWFQLPSIKDNPAGFSGATVVNERLFVTASVENTQDYFFDGDVLGSFVGLVDLNAQTTDFALLTWADGRAYQGKVEGLAVRRQLAPNHWEVLLVTDDDEGGSTALIAEIAW